jgi:hypothetical protein
VTSDLLPKLREHRALLLTATREVESMLARTVFRSQDEDVAHSLTEYVLQVREHLMLAAFIDQASCPDCSTVGRHAMTCPSGGIDVSLVRARDTTPAELMPNPPTDPPPAMPDDFQYGGGDCDE